MGRGSFTSSTKQSLRAFLQKPRHQHKKCLMLVAMLCFCCRSADAIHREEGATRKEQKWMRRKTTERFRIKTLNDPLVNALVNYYYHKDFHGKTGKERRL